MVKVYIEPKFRGEDKGDGGIRRVVEAQHKYLPEFGVETVGSIDECDVVAVHAGNWVDTSKPLVEHCHGLYWDEYQWPKWSEQLNQEVSNSIIHADAVTAPTEWVANVIKRQFCVDALVIGHGVEPPSERGIPTNQGYVLWNKTRTDPVCDEKPVNELAARVPEIKFVSTFGLPKNNVHITGRQTYEQGLNLLAGSSVYLSTSRETFGIGVLEAMAYGVPVLGWDWGGNKEIIAHKETGWLSRPGDYDDLVEGLLWLMDKSNHSKVSENAKLIAEYDYNWPTIIEKYAELYKAVGSRRLQHGVSVIIPCYNLGRYVTEAFESVVTQCDEVIIVDDHSTDDSGAICDKLVAGVANASVIHNDTNQYLAGALNTGIGAARYDLVVPLDADNRMMPNMLRVMERELRKSRKVDIAYGSVKFVNEDGVTPDINVGNGGISRWPPTEFDYKGQMTFPSSYIPSTSMYKKVVWERTGGYRRRWRTAEDADFWCRATTLGFVPKKVTEGVTLVYRQRDDSMSRTETKKDWTLWYPPRGRLHTCEPLLISVVIPVGPGHEQYVINALDSLWMQEFQQWECIVLLDGADINIVSKLPPWVTCIPLSGDGSVGPAAARNRGIEQAKGKLIYFLDADDYLVSDKALGSMYKLWKETGGYVYTDWTDDKGVMHTTTDNPCRDALTQLPTPVNILFEKESGVKFDEQMIGWEEWDFVLQLSDKGICGSRIAYPMFKYNTQLGTVRRRAHDNRDTVVNYLDSKWGAYTRGEKTLACGACGARRTVTYPAQGADSAINTQGMTLMEYTGSNTPRTYRGPMTGATYRFGAPDHRVRYVDDRDVQGLLLISDFQVYVSV